MRHRTIVCPLIENKKAIICFAKWPPTEGFFPGNGPYPAAWSRGTY